MEIKKLLVLSLLMFNFIYSQTWNVGDTPDNVELYSNGTSTIHLYDYLGSVILINFWNDGWSGCQSEASAIENNIWQVYQNEGINVLSFGVYETEEDANNWINDLGLTYKVFPDTDGSLFNEFGNTGTPYNIVLDQNMMILFSNYGYNQDDIELEINTALSKPPKKPDNFMLVEENFGSAKFEWDLNIEADLDGYRLNYTEFNTTNEKYVDLGIVNSYTINLNPNKYIFTLQAKDKRNSFSIKTDEVFGNVLPLMNNLGILILIIIFSYFIRLPKKL